MFRPHLESVNLDSMTTDSALPSLFTEQELSGIQPTGNPWLLDALDPATVPVPLQVVITSVNGPCTARDRVALAFGKQVAAIAREFGVSRQAIMRLRDEG